MWLELTYISLYSLFLTMCRRWWCFSPPWTRCRWPAGGVTTAAPGMMSSSAPRTRATATVTRTAPGPLVCGDNNCPQSVRRFMMMIIFGHFSQSLQGGLWDPEDDCCTTRCSSSNPCSNMRMITLNNLIFSIKVCQARGPAPLTLIATWAPTTTAAMITATMPPCSVQRPSTETLSPCHHQTGNNLRQELKLMLKLKC